MHLIVGLGNPGPAYDQTRHNAGFMAVDRLLERARREGSESSMSRQRFGGELFEIDLSRSGGVGTSSSSVDAGRKVYVLKPLRFMNCSGSSLVEAMNFFKMPIEQVLVMYDDYAFNTGVVKVKGEGGHGGHNGLRDIERLLGTQKYARVRIGIDPKPPQFSDPADWVLSKFSPGDLQLLSPALDKAAEAAVLFVRQGLVKAMNVINESDKDRKR